MSIHTSIIMKTALFCVALDTRIVPIKYPLRPDRGRHRGLFRAILMALPNCKLYATILWPGKPRNGYVEDSSDAYDSHQSLYWLRRKLFASPAQYARLTVFLTFSSTTFSDAIIDANFDSTKAADAWSAVLRALSVINTQWFVGLSYLSSARSICVDSISQGD